MLPRVMELNTINFRIANILCLNHFLSLCCPPLSLVHPAVTLSFSFDFLLFLIAKLSLPTVQRLSSSIFPCLSSRPSRIGDISTSLHFMMSETIQTIYFLLGYDPGNMSATSKADTKTKTHTMTNTKTKTGENFQEESLHV